MSKDKLSQIRRVAKRRKYSQPTYALKKKIVQLVVNGRMSKRHAAYKYRVSRGSIDNWLIKFANLEEKENFMSKQDELKKLKKRIQELEAVKDFQQELIAEFELETGKELAKKSLPEYLAKEIERKKKKRSSK